MKTAVVLAVSIAIAGGAGYMLIEASGPGEDVTESPRGKHKSGRDREHKSSSSSIELSESGRGGERVASPEARIARLERRVSMLEAQLRTRAGSGTGGARSLDLDDPDSSAQIHEVVEDALADAREAEQVQRDERRTQRMTQRREEALAALSGAGFTAAKAQEIGELWEAEQRQVNDLVSAARNGELEWGDLRTQVAAIRTATDATAHDTMDEGERESYEQYRPRMGRGGRGGGGRG
jgi:hypothetical protein